MDEVLLTKLLNEIIPFLLLIIIGFVTYNGFKKNQNLISEREDLVKRYILFRGDKQARLKIYEKDEQIHKELLKNISDSWKYFKKSYDQCILKLAKNVNKTKRNLMLLISGLIINSGRVIMEEYYFFGIKGRFILIIVKELHYYFFIILILFLLKIQTQGLFSLKSEVFKMDREILFFPNTFSKESEHEILYNEFEPIDLEGERYGK